MTRKAINAVLSFVPVVLLIAGCTPPKEDEWRLPSNLREVSGLAATSSGTLLMMTDEWARVYEFDPTTLAVKALFDLGDPIAGDFEGIAIDADHTYLITSDGMLFFATGDSFEVIDTGLQKICEVEGLESEQRESGTRLLVMCKTMYEKAEKDFLNIYAFDIETRSLTVHLRASYAELGIKRLNPSGIAFNNGLFYILAAKQQGLLVLDGKGALVEILPLHGHHQAEGIAILPSGEIFIADEGKNGGGKITRYQGVSDIRQ